MKFVPTERIIRGSPSFPASVGRVPLDIKKRHRRDTNLPWEDCLVCAFDLQTCCLPDKAARMTNTSLTRICSRALSNPDLHYHRPMTAEL